MNWGGGGRECLFISPRVADLGIWHLDLQVVCYTEQHEEIFLAFCIVIKTTQPSDKEEKHEKCLTIILLGMFIV